ncbi:MAG TPA: 16S rRNA methyltransferase, partial [Firmicutes bacterium]|nr:16S rRNA methyltransferase [Bacillota bacterium]
MTKENKEKKIFRFNKILKEATEQCKRSFIPKILDVIDFKDIEKFVCDLNLIAYENYKGTISDLKQILHKFDGKSISIL